MSSAWETRITELRARLDRAFGELDSALVVDARDAQRRPEPETWSLAEIAEHVVLTDHHLLLLAGKLARKARDRAQRGEPIPERSSARGLFLDLERLATSEFRWEAPEHMQPRGALELAVARRALREDRDRTRVLLDALPLGAGALASARFSPLDARFDAHQFLALVAIHAERHARQARRVQALLAASG